MSGKNIILYLCLSLLTLSCVKGKVEFNFHRDKLECFNKDYCYIFLSNSTVLGDIDSNLNGSPIDELDELCNIDVNKPQDSKKFKALFSWSNIRRACTSAHCVDGGTTEHIDWVLLPNKNYLRPDHRLIFRTNERGVTSFPLRAPLADSFLMVLTSIDQEWKNFSALTCQNWTSSLNSDAAAIAAGNAVDSNFLVAWAINCDNPNLHIICVEQGER